MSDCNKRERKLLGAVLIFPDSWPQVREILKGPDPGDPTLGKVWTAIDRVHAAGEEISITAVLDQLPVDSWVGGQLHEFTTGLLDFINAKQVIGSATRLARMRQHGELARQLRAAAATLLTSPYEDAFAELDRLREFMIRSSYRRPISIPLGNMAELTRRMFAATQPATIRSGFAVLDANVGGLPVGQLTLVGARTGKGKTTFLAALARNQIFPCSCRPVDTAAGRLELNSDPNPAHVLIVSCELTSEDLCGRLACDVLDMTADDLRANRAAAIDADPYALMGSQEYLSALDQHGRLTMIDEGEIGSTSITRVCASIDAWADQVTAAEPDATMLVLLDYLQRIDPTEQQAREARHRQIEMMAKSLATLAKRRRVALVAAVQLNDATDNAEPVRGDCRESKGANNEAGLILLLHAWSGQQRAALQQLRPDAPELRAMSMFCDKARFGRDSWRAVLDFDGRHGRITDAVDGTPNYMLDPRTLEIANGAAKPKRPRSR